MKKIIFILCAGAVGFVFAWTMVSQRSAQTLLRERALWENEKSALQTGLDSARSRKRAAPSVIEKTKFVGVKEEISPREIIDRLQKIKISSGVGQNKNTRLAIHQFEILIALGPSALPAIREFLLRNEEIDYESGFNKKESKDGKMATDFVLPPSLRFGLFDAVKQIGGSDAEKLLAEILGGTGRGAEVAYLARALQEMAPNKYRDISLHAARELLSAPLAANASGLDKYDREYLYGVLALYGDASLTALAQTQLIRSDGGIDRGALQYLQQTMGVQALPAIAQAYQDATLDPSKKEPLVRYALSFAGADEQATAFWHKAITDPALPFGQRRELIEDLNQDGFQNEKNPTARDAQLIAQRLALVDQLHNEIDNPVLKDAWREAGKDLQNMGLKYLSQPEAPYALGKDLKDLRLRLSQTTP